MVAGTGMVGVVNTDPEVNRVTLGDVNRWVDDLVVAETRSRAAWHLTSDNHRAGLICLIREELLRLLEDPHWIPSCFWSGHPNKFPGVKSGVQVRDGDRITVTITLHMEDMDAAMARAAGDAAAIEELEALARTLEQE